ncbi:MAG: hypothetical protein QOI63_981, partial [Thermoplasmata archaeon]|nr:hypothetical protein [Thermoplasmata archaeon]
AAADKADRASQAAFGRNRRIADLIPPGQPILVGHHSEGRHRRDLQRMDDAMRRTVEEGKRAEELRRRAAGVGSGGISGDDPEAIRKLEAELANVEASQAWMKRVNAAHARFLKDPASVDAEDFPEHVKTRIRTYKPPYPWEKHPCAPWQLTNNSANARRIRKRIEDLKKRDARPPVPERLVGEVRVVDNAELNRLQLFFPGKPDEATRKQLKGHGFRWTPTLGCWQAFRSSRATWAAGVVLGQRLDGPAEPDDEQAMADAIAALRGDTTADPIHRSHQTAMEDRGDHMVERCGVCGADGIAALFRPCRGAPESGPTRGA